MARYQIVDRASGRKLDVIEWDGATDFGLADHQRAEPDDGAPVWQPAPATVTPLQMRRALRAAGLRDMIEAFVAAQDEDAREAWDYALEIRRDDPLIALAADALGRTADEIDDVFRLAASL